MKLEEAAEILPKSIYEELKNLLRDVPEQNREKAIDAVVRKYKEKSMEIEEAAGIIAAQSISEPATQLTMRSYHVAGSVEAKITLGLPRLIEIFDARREPVTPSMKIYLKKSYNTKEKASQLSREIKEVLVEDVADEVSIDLVGNAVEITLNKSLMKNYEVTEKKVASALGEALEDVSISERENKIIVKLKTEDVDVKELQKLRGKIMAVHISGIPNIKQVIVSQDGDRWVLTTIGSNLEKILEVDGVDVENVRTNNIHEICDVLGIEAARSAIIEEASKTLKEQGIDVDIRYLMLVADVMTADGIVKPIGRYGVAGAKGSVLARANFEETIKHLTTAAVTNDVDKLESVVENVILNQIVPVGTGAFELIYRPKKEK
jgi:DNA-directed RNA polymerase subunit A"